VNVDAAPSGKNWITSKLTIFMSSLAMSSGMDCTGRMWSSKGENREYLTAVRVLDLAAVRNPSDSRSVNNS
jgi:hypothetical protein